MMAFRRVGFYTYLRITIILLLSTISFPSSLLSQRSELILATGSLEGTYYTVGLGIQKAVEKQLPGVAIRVIPTMGSVENIELLLGGEADLAIAQHDVVSDYYHFRRHCPEFFEHVSGIASLYIEQIHVIVRRSLRIQLFEQLAGRGVAVGPQGSGTYFNAVCLLKTADIYEEVTPVSVSFEKTMEDLKAKELDAAIITTGSPSPMIEKLLGQGDFHLISLKANILRKIGRDYPDFISVSIPAHTYPNQMNEITTIGIAALLICRNDVPKTLVSQIAEALFAHSGEIDSRYSRYVNLESAKLKMTLPLHPGAEDYYRSLSPLTGLRVAFQYVPFAFLLFLFLIFLYITAKQKWRKNAYVRLFRIILVLGCFWIIGTFFMHYFEHQVSENFLTIWDSFWSIATYLFSGFEDKFPVTPLGKAVSVFLMIGGIGLIAFFTAEFASLLTQEKIKGRAKMKRMHNHILIFHWNYRGEKIVEEIHDPVAFPKTPIIVLSEERVDEEQYERRSEFHNVQFVSGDVLNKKFLRFVNAHNARSIIILADDRCQDPDGKSALIALAIDILSQEVHSEDGRKPHIVAEVMNHRKTEHLKDAGVDETVCATDYGLGILAQSAMYEKLSQVYDQLLEYSKDTNEIYALDSNNKDDIPENIWSSVFEGKSFIEVARFFSGEHRDPDNPAILIGVRRGEHVILNPRKVKDDMQKHLEFDSFREDDHPIFLSYEKPNLKKLTL
jgi:TRAP transporter TAXI family solute receptor